MKTTLWHRLKGVRTWFESLSRTNKALLTGGALIVLLAVVVTVYVSRPRLTLLFGDLQPSYASAVLAHLDESGVTYAVRGNAIYVPSDQVDQLRMEISGAGILTGATDLSLFETAHFGISAEQEQRLMQETLAQSLAAAIRRFDSVKDAAVTVSLGVDSPFASERRPSKVGVILELKPNRSLTTKEAEAIRSFVAASVPNVDRDQIVLTDTNQVELTASEDRIGLERTAEIAAFIEGEERKLEAKIRRILTPAYGDLGFVVSVSAEYDFDQRQKQTDIVAPGAPVSSERLTDRNYETSVSPDGAAGTVTNIPAYEEATGDTGTRSYTEHSEERTNYEISRTQEMVIAEPTLTRLSVSVHVNKQLAAGGEETERITRLVEGAIGYSADRGDRIVVEGTPTVTVPPKVTEEPAPLPLPWYRTWWGMLSLGGGALLLLLLLMRLRRQLTASEEVTLPVALPAAPAPREATSVEVKGTQPPEPEAEPEPEPAAEPEPEPEEEPEPVIIQTPEDVKRQQIRRQVVTKLRQPEEAAKVLRSWLKR